MTVAFERPVSTLLICPRMVWRSSTSSRLKGSSNKKQLGSRTTARATATRCFSPSEMWLGSRSSTGSQVQKHAATLRDPPARGRAIESLDVQRKHDVLAHGQGGIERIELEHHRDVALLGPKIVHALSGDDDVAGARSLEPGDDAQGRRLAAARRTQKTDDLARRDGQVDVAHGGERAEPAF